MRPRAGEARLRYARSVRWLVVLVVASACGGPGTLDAAIDEGDAGSRGWRAVASAAGAAILRPSGPEGCLLETGERLAPGQEQPLLAAGAFHLLIGEDGSVVRRGEASELERPEVPEPARSAVVERETLRSVYDDGGCPTPDGGAALPEGEAIVALARSHDDSYRGFVVIDRDLGLAPVRVVGSEGWIYPWHASLQLVREVEGGFVIGGGALIGPRTIVTAAHLGVEPGWCYSREPSTGAASAAGRLVCDNVATGALAHPDGVDVALVTLLRDEPPPYAHLRATPLAVGDAIYTSRWSELHRNAFADATVSEVGASNAFCAPWPAGSSFSTAELVIGGGDSGGPAWIGDELVGVVHGEACRGSVLEPVRHLWAHLPGVRDFVAP